MNPIAKCWWIAKGVGWDNLPRRILQAWRVRSGSLRRRLDPDAFSDEAFTRECPASVDDQPALWSDRAKRFFPRPSPESLRAITDDDTWRQRVTDVCDKAIAGEYLFFSHWYGQLGWPPDFTLDPVHSIRWPVGEHWLLNTRSDLPRDDIKLVWEASRLSLAYSLAREYVRSGDAAWAQRFWEMFDAWVEQNPCQQSVAWGCGQEMTFRLMALLFGAMNTLDSPSATPQRLHALSRLAWRTGKHISLNINQARMQGNNHAISEAVGLWTVGLLFDEFARSEAWQAAGQRILAQEVARQIYDDGSFVQHSLNYHRVLMDDLLWAIGLAERNDTPLPPVVQDRFARATGWLAEMVDPDSGGAPNYGNNDGTLVLPLSTCDYRDYRPTLQAALLMNGKRLLPDGLWDEKAVWLTGEEALSTPVEPRESAATFAANDGGYYVLRGPTSWAMTRCHTYRHRPCQADMLHVDVWHRGGNVLRDAGSYMYRCPPPWQDYFHSTAAHNTVEIDGLNQMTKGPRFLWLRWTRSTLRSLGQSANGRIGAFAAEHMGYAHRDGRVIHRRTICRIDDTYVIVDDLLGSAEHDVCLRWRLCDADWRGNDQVWRGHRGDSTYSVSLATPERMTCRLTSGEASPVPEGWQSLYYGEKTPSPTLLAAGRIALPVSVLTIVDFDNRPITVSGFDPGNPEKPIVLSGLDDPEIRSSLSDLTGGRLEHE